jgi:hypothetical protein
LEGIQGTMKMQIFGCPTKFKANSWQLVKDKYEVEKKKKIQVIDTHVSNWSCYKRFDYMFSGSTKINGAFHPFLSSNCEGEWWWTYPRDPRIMSSTMLNSCF